MKRIGTIVSMMVLAGSITSNVFAANGILLKEQFRAADYCHMKFPAIKERTLAGNNPELKDSSSGDVIDFYGSCDESPTGQDQIAAQKLEEHLHRGTFGYDG
jgi:hypothetical protein